MKATVTLRHCIFFAVLVLIFSCKKETSCEGCAARGNNPPISVAGPDQLITLPTDSVSLDGRTSSDPDGRISSYLWTKVSGPSSFSIIRSSDSVAKVKTLVKGVYSFELKVTDDGGLATNDTVKVTVIDPSQPNLPPAANAGLNQTISLPGNTAFLDGSASSDPDNNITAYLWTKISGPSSSSIVNPGLIVTQASNLVQGTYLFELKVTDAGGLFSKDTVQVIVNPSTTAPVANAGPDIIITLPLDSVYLSMGLYEPQAIYQWSQLAGPSAATITNSAFTISAVPNIALVKHLIPGLYSFRLQVNNATGMNADTVNVLVVNDPLDVNTITFLNLEWILADEYGIGLIDLSLRVPATPNLFSQSASGTQWDLIPIQVYLQTDPPGGTWLTLNVTLPGPVYYSYDSALPHIWLMRLPVDSTWVGKRSCAKIKIL
jgi:hypothetical protein